MSFEAILAPLLNLGIGGAMAAAVLYLANHLVTKIIPKLIEDSRAAQKEEVKTLKETHAFNQSVMDKMQAAYLHSLEKQQETTDRLTSAVYSLCDQVKDNTEQIRLLKEERGLSTTKVK